MSVIVPVVVPETDTFTPSKGTPCSSTTVPETVLDCCVTATVTFSAYDEKEGTPVVSNRPNAMPIPCFNTDCLCIMVQNEKIN